jgi:hypothetical protein
MHTIRLATGAESADQGRPAAGLLGELERIQDLYVLGEGVIPHRYACREGMRAAIAEIRRGYREMIEGWRR